MHCVWSSEEDDIWGMWEGHRVPRLSPSPSLEKAIKKVAAHGAPPTFKKGLEQPRHTVPPHILGDGNARPR